MSELERQQHLITKLRDELELTNRKISKLKALVLLVDPAVSDQQVSSTAVTQWAEFIKEFPDESSPVSRV